MLVLISCIFTPACAVQPPQWHSLLLHFQNGGVLCLTVLLLICAPAIIVFSMENIAAWLKTQSFSSCTLRQQVVFFFNSLRIFTKKAKNILRFQIPHCKKKEQNIFLKKIYYRNLSSLKITEEEKIQKKEISLTEEYFQTTCCFKALKPTKSSWHSSEIFSITIKLIKSID